MRPLIINHGTTIVLICPHCGERTETHLMAFLAANNFGASCECLACHLEYYVEIHCLTRAAEQRDEADGELAGKAPNALSTEDK